MRGARSSLFEEDFSFHRLYRFDWCGDHPHGAGQSVGWGPPRRTALV